MAATSIDIVVESHRLASERRSQGKPAWDRKIDVRSIIQRDQGQSDDEYVVGIANEIGQLLKGRLPADLLDTTSDNFDWEIEEAVEALCQMTVLEFQNSEFRAVDEFNGWMSQIYDWADLNRVWLGK